MMYDVSDDEEGQGLIFVAVKGEGTFVGPCGISTKFPCRQVQMRCPPIQHISNPGTALEKQSDFKPANLLFMESVETRHSDHTLSAKVLQHMIEELSSKSLPPPVTEAVRIDSQAKYVFIVTRRRYLNFAVDFHYFFVSAVVLSAKGRTELKL